ncbi:hypothetical protein HNR00_002045 [Methylorubrum rhodinum]|jgi:hypothetical protein|uniref:Uncharacterized protein n=1 Tax=Methylorubrum rhodinum TaxID=29428 RepID=A0A840ZJJ5_9HYPH|nr:hypothetical protein [Methylorubrum rhodinum]MBB5757334.1 hypothetical protein [Methylorubrum rhodinum]
MMPNRLTETEATLAITDRAWRAEMIRAYGPDAVLRHGFRPTASGLAGTRLRETFDARRRAVKEWRDERRPHA